MYDIIIVGGGISGSMAAIAAARQGAKILLIEDNGYLGGSLTASGVGPMMTFHAGEKQVIQGITGELIDRMKAKGMSPGHIVDTTGYTYTVTPFNAEGMKVELEAMILEAGGQILYHSRLAKVNVDDKKIQSITVCNKSGLTDYEAACFIDATGDGDLSSWAGVPCTKGRESDGATQPMTLNVKMNNVDVEAIKTYMRERPEQFVNSIPLLDQSPRLSIGGFGDLVAKGKEEGSLSLNEKGSILLFETDQPGEVILNTTRVLGCDSTDPMSLSQAETKARKEAQELIAFLKTDMPGFEEAHLVCTGPSIGVRSSRQIVGHYTLEARELLEGKSFKDTIAHSGYPIDIHSPDGQGCDSTHLEYGSYYSIPYGTLTNPTVDNLITVGRCISASFEAQAAIRVTPTVGAIGHAGGVGAWLYVSEQVKAASDVDVKKLQETITQQGGFLDLEGQVKS